MRSSTVPPGCRRARHSRFRKDLARGARGAFLLFLASALVALAGTPANLQDALQAQRALVAENPTNADLLNDLGNLLALAGDLEAAEEVYLQALAIDPNDIASHYNLALILMEQGRSKPAQSSLLAILELEPRHAWAHYQLGTLFADQNNRKKAVHHYAQAFAIDRSLTSPKVNPHIVENHLATDSLLKMYVEESPSTQAPRMYEEPDSVTKLLLPPASAEPAPEPEPEPNAGTQSEPTAESPPKSRRIGASYEPPAAADDGFATTAGETREPDSAFSQMDESNGSEPTHALPGRLDSPTRESRQSGQTETSGELGESDLRQSASDDDPFDSSGSFVPGVQSTGRLDIELLPAVDSGATVSPT